MDPKKSDWKRPPGRIERAYREELRRLLDKYLTLPTTEDLGEITTRLVQWGQITDVFRRYAERTASRMVTGLAVQNASNWREAAAQSTRGAEIYRGLRLEMRGPVGRAVRGRIAHNAGLIRSMPAEVAQEATAYIGVQQRAGVRSKVIARELRRRIPALTRTKATLIARTETSKAETALTRARAESLGMDWYEWNTSEDARVRKSHQLMDKVLCRFSDPPAPETLAKIKSSLGKYNAGEAPNDRCLATPLVDLAEVRWPHKVYHDGRIQVMTRPAFLKIAPGYRVAA